MRTVNLLALTACAAALVVSACSDDDEGSGLNVPDGTGGTGGTGGMMAAGAGGDDGMMAGGAGGMMAGGAGGMMAGGAGGMMAGGAGGMMAGGAGGMMAGGAGGMGMTGDAACSGCVELSVPYAAPEADEAAGTAQTSFTFDFAPTDMSTTTATVRLMVLEANPDAYVKLYAQNGGEGPNAFQGNFGEPNISFGAPELTAGAFVDLTFDVAGGDIDGTEAARVGVQVGVNPERPGAGEALVYIDSITFAGGTADPDPTTFTDDAEGMTPNSFDPAFVKGSTVTHLP